MIKLINSCGSTVGFQAYSVYRNSLFLGYIIFIGTSQTLSPITSVYFHEGDYSRVRYVLKKAFTIVIIGSAAMGAILALFPVILIKMYGVKNDPATASYVGSAIRLFVISYPFLGINFLLGNYLQSIGRHKLSSLLTLLQGLVLPVLLVWGLSVLFEMKGVWAGLILTEVLSMAFAFAAMAVIRRREKPEPAAFLLPKENTDDKFEASLLPDVSRAAEVSQNAGIWIDERADAFQNKAALAVEEMLVGIITANNGKECIIDLCIINEETEIVLNIKDNGVTWNPTVLDRELRYEFDNISVLNSISSLIEFDKVLGMNSTRIHLSK